MQKGRDGGNRRGVLAESPQLGVVPVADGPSRQGLLGEQSFAPDRQQPLPVEQVGMQRPEAHEGIVARDVDGVSRFEWWLAQFVAREETAARVNGDAARAAVAGSGQVPEPVTVGRLVLNLGDEFGLRGALEPHVDPVTG